METLLVRVFFVNGTQADYAILGSMPMVKFCEAVVRRHGVTINKCDFLDAFDRPVVAEVLTED